MKDTIKTTTKTTNKLQQETHQEKQKISPVWNQYKIVTESLPNIGKGLYWITMSVILIFLLALLACGQVPSREILNFILKLLLKSIT
ncbi:hypothetical protein ACA30_07540 [Virgibacillus soli]|nr:hypothetical protein ACA30_07540 [Virgibacillus soli]